jgi:hypothetical protein
MNPKRVAVFSALFCATILCPAGLRAQSLMAQLVDGGGWKTTFFLVNNDTTSHQYTISFTTEGGAALTLPLANGTLSSAVTGTVAASGLEIIETAGAPSGSTAVGWAFINTDTHVTGFAVFRQQVPGRTDFEATVPFETQLYQVINVPFDNINGFATGVALVNDGTAAESIQATVLNTSGQPIAVEPAFSIPASGHTSFNLASQFPETAGISGIIQFSAPSPVLAGLGLRFNSQGAFTSFPVSGR